jgi:hypothetical protein
VLKAPTHKPGRFGFRGDLALKFAAKKADEAKPPELSVYQILTVAHAGETQIPYFAAYLHSFEHLRPLTEILGETLKPAGKYFMYCNNIDLAKRYRVPYAGTFFYVLPIDEATVWNEMLELLRIDKNDIKKLDTAGKLDYVADAALKYDEASFDTITFEEGLQVMGPVRNRNENRPV